KYEREIGIRKDAKGRGVRTVLSRQTGISQPGNRLDQVPGNGGARDAAGVGIDVEQIGADFAQGGAVQLGQLDLQHDLLDARHAQQVDDLRRREGALNI